tara:strand:- start:286348 stop:286578 length:231 start_codon:yes stop_codon:yes gene_type:complete
MFNSNESERNELVHRAKSKKAELESKMHKLMADSNDNISESKKELEAKIDKLNHAISEATDNFSEKVAEKINNILS